MASPAVHSEHLSEQKRVREPFDDAENDNQEVKKTKVKTKCFKIIQEHQKKSFFTLGMV